MGFHAEFHGKSAAIGEPKRHFLPSHVDQPVASHNIQVNGLWQYLPIKPFRYSTARSRQRQIGDVRQSEPGLFLGAL